MEFRRSLRKQFDMCSARGETRHGEAVEMTRQTSRLSEAPMDPVEPRITTVDGCMGYALLSV